MLPHLNNVENAQAAVVAARYPQVPGVPRFRAGGRARLVVPDPPHDWDLTHEEYCNASDLWSLDPDGNMLIGIRNQKA